MAAVADLRVQITQSIIGAGLIEKAFSGISEAIGKAIDIGIDYNAMLQRTESAYKQLFGSTDAARAKIEEFQRFAAKTPFELPGVLDMGRALSAAKISADNLVPTMRTLGAAISSTGNFSQEQVRGVTTAVTQMLAKGKVSAEEINQLADRGIFGWDILAEHFGTSTGEIMKAAEKGKISGKDFVDAMEEAARKHGWVDLLSDSAQTFDGAMSTIVDSAKMAIAQGFKPLFEEGSKYLGRFAAFLTSVDVSAAIAGIAAGVQTTVDIIREDLGPALAGLAGGGGLADFLAEAGARFLDFFRGADFVIRSLGVIFSNLRDVVGGFAGFAGAKFEEMGVKVAVSLHSIGSLFGFLGDVLAAGGRAIGAFAEGWRVQFASMLDIAGTLGEVMGAVLTGRFGDIGTIIGRGLARAQAAGEQAGDFFATIPSIFANIGDAAERLGEREAAIAGAANPMLADIARRANASGVEWTQASKRIIDGFGDAAIAADRDSERIAAAFGSAADKVRAAGATVDALGGAYRNMGNNALGAGNNAANGANNAAGAVRDLTDALKDAGDATSEFARLWDEYVRGPRVGGLTQAEMQDRLARLGALQAAGVGGPLVAPTAASASGAAISGVGTTVIIQQATFEGPKSEESWAAYMERMMVPIRAQFAAETAGRR